MTRLTVVLALGILVAVARPQAQGAAVPGADEAGLARLEAKGAAGPDHTRAAKE